MTGDYSQKFIRYLKNFINKFIENNHVSRKYKLEKCLNCQKETYRVINSSFYIMKKLTKSNGLEKQIKEIKIINPSMLIDSSKCKHQQKQKSSLNNNYISLGDFIIFETEFDELIDKEKLNIPTQTEIGSNKIQIKGIIGSHRNNTSFNFYRYKNGT